MLQRIFKQLKVVTAAGVVFASMSMAVLSPVSTVGAAPIDVLDKCDTQSRVCADRNDANNTLPTLLKNIINLLLIVIGFIAVLLIIIGAIRYTTSGGDPGQTKSARDTIVYAVVGLVIAIMAFAIVNFVLANL